MNLLRGWLLYWDCLAYPTQNLFNFGLPAEFEFLENEGIFSRYPIEHQGGEATRILLDVRRTLFSRLERENPGAWATFTSPQSWDGEQALDQRALRVHLTSVLPIPNEDVPLEEILRFRDRRADERVALMAHIDEIYQEVLGAPDRPLAENTAIEKLAQGAKDQIDIFHEAGMRFRLMDIAADFNLLAGAVAGLGAMSLGATWPIALGNSLVAGGSVTIGKVAGLINPKVEKTPFRYVGSYHQEVFGQ